MALIDSGERLRFAPDIVRRESEVARWGLLIREPRLLTERSEQFFNVNDVREGGQTKDGMAVAEKEPLNWRRWRRGGHDASWDPWAWNSSREVERGSRRVRSFVRLLRAFLRLVKGRGSPTSARSRCRRLWHLDRAGRQLTLYAISGIPHCNRAYRLTRK